MLIGYMRVSSNDERQSVALQHDALIAAGVDPRHLHQDHASGARDNRPGLTGRAFIQRITATMGPYLANWRLRVERN